MKTLCLALLVVSPLVCVVAQEKGDAPAAKVNTSFVVVNKEGMTSSPEPLKTKPLHPEHYAIRLADLPAPYATRSADQHPKEQSFPDNPVLEVPEGFQVNIFAKGLKNARMLTVAPNGDVFVVQSKENKIVILRDTNKDGAADDIYTFAEGKDQGLNQPFGIDFHEGYLYIANTDGVVRYAYQEGQTEMKEKQEDFITGITSGGYHQHWTRNILFHQGKLFFTVGSASNASPEALPRASIQVFDEDGSLLIAEDAHGVIYRVSYHGK